MQILKLTQFRNLSLYNKSRHFTSMGIDGLLRFLRPVTQKEHISTFKNQRVGIDVMSWLYRGCYSCNFELANHGQSIKYLYYILEMIEILSFYNIKPIFVFDGRSFDLKNQTNQKRIKEKQQNKEKAIQLMKQGKIEQARKYFSRCIFIDQKIISTTMNVMKSKNLDFMVAPYEADCQIAKLRRLNLIDVAISQDSDLIAYGVNTILKLTQNGDCDYVDPNKWSPRDVDSQFLKEYFAMNFVNRLESAILAGSDYNPSIKGIGIMRAVKHMYRQVKMRNVVNKLKNQKVYADKIPQNYEDLIQKAKMIFLFATVYNPIEKRLQQLNPDLWQSHKLQNLTQQQLLKIVGEHYPQYIQKQVYLGITKAKDLTRRDIISVNVRQMFAINKQNMLVHQSINNKRKQEENKLKEQRQQDIKNGNIKVYDMKQNISAQSTKKVEKNQLTEQQKQKRKQERKNRIIKLQDVMNSVVQMIKQQEQEDIKNQLKKSEPDEDENNIQLLKKKLNEVYTFLGSQKQLNNSSNKSEGSSQSENNEDNGIDDQNESKQSKNKNDQLSQSQSYDLGFLNPFGKLSESMQKTATKLSSNKKNTE